VFEQHGIGEGNFVKICSFVLDINKRNEVGIENGLVSETPSLALTSMEAVRV
jgi:hypothetical protein